MLVFGLSQRKELECFRDHIWLECRMATHPIPLIYKPLE
jgi:hypothetical protein